MLIRVFCVLSMLNKLPPGVCWRGGGGGGGGTTGLLNKGGGSNRLIASTSPGLSGTVPPDGLLPLSGIIPEVLEYLIV